MKRFLFIVFIVFIPIAAYASDAGGEGGHGFGDFWWRLLNFAILAGVLYWLAAKAVKGFFVGNRSAIRETLDNAIAAKEQAEKKLQEHSEKLEKATKEIDEIVESIKAQGMSEKEKIIEDARRTAQKMKEDAKTRIDQEFKVAVNRLRAEAAELSVQMAEEIVKKNIEQKDHDAMVKEFLDRMVIQN